MKIPAELIPPAIELIRLGVDAIEGKTNSASEVAKSLVHIGLRLVPVEELKAYLTEGAKTRAELAADLAEHEKFGFEQ